MADNKDTSVAIRDAVALIDISKNLWLSKLYPNIQSAAQAFAIVQYGYENEIGPMTALQNISMISGKPVVEVKLQQAKAQQKGTRFTVVEWTDTKCVVKANREGYPEVEGSFTIEEAKKAGLANKDNWTKYPKDMLRYRAVSRAIKQIAPDCFMGALTPDEAEELVGIPTIDNTDNRKNAKEGERRLVDEKGFDAAKFPDARLAHLMRMDSGEPTDDIDLATDESCMAYCQNYLVPTWKSTKTSNLAGKVAEAKARTATTGTKAAPTTPDTPKDAPQAVSVPMVGDLRDKVSAFLTPEQRTEWSDSNLIELYTPTGLAEAYAELTQIAQANGVEA